MKKDWWHNYWVVESGRNLFEFKHPFKLCEKSSKKLALAIAEDKGVKVHDPENLRAFRLINYSDQRIQKVRQMA